MAQIKISTTGLIDPVIIEDLGAVSLSHPNLNFLLHDTDVVTNLLSLDEIKASQDLQDHITAGNLLANDENGNNIPNVVNFVNTIFERKLRVSSDDTTSNYLFDKLSGATDKIELSVLNDGDNESLAVNIGGDVFDKTDDDADDVLIQQISGLTATTVQEALEEIEADISSVSGLVGGKLQIDSTAEASGLTSTTSSTLQIKLEHSFTANTNSFYVIIWYMELSNSNNNKIARGYADLNNSTILGEADGIAPNSNNTYVLFTGMDILEDLPAVEHTVRLKYAKVATGTVTARRARIYILRSLIN